ncbi:unnamed protein product [Adineta ricciae]|uniref:Poly [ADP-ribose] polymerase n=1 Tax=Adineta ricciae TaxID=249248 RepID=A0A815QAB8_ADIRI|nr:unnamed protein product [Adineta ricciae]
MTTDKNRAEILSKAEVRLCRLHPWSNFPGFGFTLEPSLGPPHRTCMVESNSPAEAGGLRIRDVILAVNNQQISDTDFNRIQTMINEAYNQNSRIDLLVIKQKSYELVEKRKIKIDQASATVIDTPATMPDSYRNFPQLTPRICSICISGNETVFGFDLTSGVNKIGLYAQKVYPNSQAEHSGLRNNDRIIEVNGQNIDEKSSRSSANNYSGTVQCRSGDLTKEQVDAIVIATASSRLVEVVLQEAGDTVRNVYKNEQKRVGTNIICTNGGNLACQRIYFIPCPDMSHEANKWTFRTFVTEGITTAINDRTTQIQSIAFPAIGCGKFGHDPNFVAQTLVAAVVYEFNKQPSLKLDVYFVIQSNQREAFDAFKNECIALENQRNPQIRRDEDDFTVALRTLTLQNEYYTKIENRFFETMTSKQCKKIVAIQMIWHRRWFLQYRAHRAAFYQRLKKETEQLLFHGCSEIAASGIIDQGFDRSYAGKHGTSYGYGVYFSTMASYSHSYASPNSKGERCMFLARVLVGNTVKGNSSMKVCPPGYDTTTDGNHIYVIYHDAQAFGGYLITYK